MDLVTLAEAMLQEVKVPHQSNQAVAPVGAGIGITPMISMSHNIAAHVRDCCRAEQLRPNIGPGSTDSGSCLP